MIKMKSVFKTRNITLFWGVIGLLFMLCFPVRGSVEDETCGEGLSRSSYERLLKTAREKGYAKILLKLDVKNIKQLTANSLQYNTIVPGSTFQPGGFQADLELDQAIQAAAFTVLHRLNNRDYRLNHTYSTLPYLALDVSPGVLELLPSIPGVLDIFEDKPTKLVGVYKPNTDEESSAKQPLENPFTSDSGETTRLNTSTALIGATAAWSMGYTGSGWYVAILDTGIRRSHQFFQGKTIKEACYSANNDCPNSGTSMIGTGAAAHYESTYEGYDHGTHVAGIAAGKYGSRAGVAKDSNIIAVQVFSRFGSADCGGPPCIMSYVSDLVKALEYIYTLRSTYSIAAVNMSLGWGNYSSYCNGEPQRTAIANLKSVRIATVIATGNDGYCGYISSPACIEPAVSVGASNDSDIEADFNNWNKTLQEFFAPGVAIYSSTGGSNSSYESWDGTSMATPHVTGAWALMRNAYPTASVNEIFSALRSTGEPITTLCPGGGTCPRIQVDDAIASFSPSVSLTVTSPNGGETWTVGQAYPITWTSTGTVGNVKIEYTKNNGSSWYTVTSSTANDGSYTWTIPTGTSSQCKVRIKEASGGSPSDTSNAVFSIIDSVPPKISLSRTSLYFRAVSGSPAIVNGLQRVWVNNSGGGTLNWSASDNSSWLTTVPGSGTNAGVLTVSVNPAGLSVGNRSGSITVSDASASNSPRTITVTLDIIASQQDKPPFGYFETPVDGAVVSSSIPVTGWVLDDVEVKSVKIYSGTIYVGDAVFVEGARPDVEQAFPGYPKNYQAGWGYMLLTYFLPGGGKGKYTLFAKAEDIAGKQVTLGSITITVNNANNVKPFGAIDTPAQGGSASGSKYLNYGWVLTPQPNQIPVDGSTIKVYVDGKYLGQPVYNLYRSDVAGFFPGYANTAGAGGYFEWDTTPYTNGVHAIMWTAIDNAGNNDGVGSRFFTIANIGTASKLSASQSLDKDRQSWDHDIDIDNDIEKFFRSPAGDSDPDREPVGLKSGFAENIEPQIIYPGKNGIIDIEARLSDRLVIELDNSTGNGYREGQRFSPAAYRYHGCLVLSGESRPLPVGSTLDGETGIFYWQVGPGLSGNFLLEFIGEQEGIPVKKKKIMVKIKPR
jgi:subtilisin family serine protease